MQPEVSFKVDELAGEIASRTGLVGDCPAVRTGLQGLGVLFDNQVATPFQLTGLILGSFLAAMTALLLAVPAYLFTASCATALGPVLTGALWLVLSFASWRLLVRRIVFKVGSKEITTFFRICANAGLTHDQMTLVLELSEMASYGTKSMKHARKAIDDSASKMT